MIIKRSPWTLALTLPFLAVACDDSTSSGPAEVTLLLTDAPGDVAAVWVEIEEIYLQGDDEGDEGGRVVLLSEDAAADLGPIELTSLAGTTLGLVTGVEVPAGSYGQLRFVIAGAVLETETGEVYAFDLEHPEGTPATGTLHCPSCTETGIKVILPEAVAELETGAEIVLLDFDVTQSFGQAAGMSGTWVMHPVIRGAEVEATGSISGTVDVLRDAESEPLVAIPECPAGTPRGLSAFIPMATAETLVDDEGEPVVATEAVEEDGTFTFPYLSPDEYDLAYAEEVQFDGWVLGFEAVAPSTTAVVMGEDAEVAYTITAATCTES